MGLAFAREFARREHSVVLLHGTVRLGHEGILDDFRAVGADLVGNPAFGPAIKLGVFRWILGELKRADPVAAVCMFNITDAKFLGPACRLAGCPHVSSVQNDLVFYGNPVMRRLKAAVFGVIYRRTVDLAICTSEKMRVALLEQHRMLEHRVRVLPNGIDTARQGGLNQLERRAAREKLGVAEHEVLLVNVGRLHPQKGQDVLLEAISRLDGSSRTRLKLVLIGDSDPGKSEAWEFASALRGQVSRGGLDQIVRFAGWRSDVLEVLQAADIYVHSANWEGPPLPLAILEALACGLPVIMTDCAGRPEEFVDGHHGYCVEAGQAGQLAKALVTLLAAKPEHLRAMGKNCRVLVEEKYEISTISKRFVDFVLGVTPRRPMAS
jgi:glycosyltransferase involved in cell wall biosynthesis